MTAVTAQPPPSSRDRRPPNGSRRGKNAYLVYALITVRPNITRTQLKGVLEWDDDRLDQALDDLRVLAEEVGEPVG